MFEENSEPQPLLNSKHLPTYKKTRDDNQWQQTCTLYLTVMIFIFVLFIFTIQIVSLKSSARPISDSDSILHAEHIDSTNQKVSTLAHGCENMGQKEKYDTGIVVIKLPRCGTTSLYKHFDSHPNVTKFSQEVLNGYYGHDLEDQFRFMTDILGREGISGFTLNPWKENWFDNIGKKAQLRFVNFIRPYRKICLGRRDSIRYGLSMYKVWLVQGHCEDIWNPYDCEYYKNLGPIKVDLERYHCHVLETASWQQKLEHFCEKNDIPYIDYDELGRHYFLPDHVYELLGIDFPPDLAKRKTIRLLNESIANFAEYQEHVAHVQADNVKVKSNNCWY